MIEEEQKRGNRIKEVFGSGKKRGIEELSNNKYKLLPECLQNACLDLITECMK